MTDAPSGRDTSRPDTSRPDASDSGASRSGASRFGTGGADLPSAVTPRAATANSATPSFGTGSSATASPNSVAAPAVNDRILFALRQAALLGVALLVAGFVTDRLRPEEALDRGIASTPYLWAIVLWLIVLLVNALAFEHSQTRMLEGIPLSGAAAIGAIIFVVGLLSLDGGSFGRRVVYLFATSLGAIMFWWALISLGFLLTRRVTN